MLDEHKARYYLKLAEGLGLTDDADKLWGLYNSVMWHGANPLKAQLELDGVYEVIDECIEAIRTPPTEEEVARKHPGFCKGCD